MCTPSTRIIINFYSRLWTLPLGMAARLHIANQSLNQSWLTLADLDNMLALSGFEVVRGGALSARGAAAGAVL